jgi:hypothetical protein
MDKLLLFASSFALKRQLFEGEISVSKLYCGVGSSDFGTLTYYKQI